MSVLQFPKPHRINVWDGAKPEDIAYTREKVDLCFDLFASALAGLLGNLQQNLPVTTPTEFTPIFDKLADMRFRLVDHLNDLEDRAAENQL